LISVPQLGQTIMFSFSMVTFFSDMFWTNIPDRAIIAVGVCWEAIASSDFPTWPV
jgi:hypothetical protein